jgi:hypothetical protein
MLNTFQSIGKFQRVTSCVTSCVVTTDFPKYQQLIVNGLYRIMSVMKL